MVKAMKFKIQISKIKSSLKSKCFEISKICHLSFVKHLSFVNLNLNRLPPKRRNLFTGLLALLVVGLLTAAIGIALKPLSSMAAWMDESWLYRKAITVTNSSGGTLTNYPVSFTLDTSTLITAGKMQSNCSDIRVADISGAPLSYWIEESGAGACNTTTTKIWVKIPSMPTTGANIYVYYSNSAVASASNGVSVFDLFDTFNTVDASKWNTTGSPTAAGSLALTNGQGISSRSTYTDASGVGRLITSVEEAVTTLVGGKIGFTNTMDLATHFNTDKAAALIAGSTEETVANIGGANLIAHYLLEETVTTDAHQFMPSGYLDTGKLGQAVSMYGNAAGTVGSTLTFNSGAQISGNNYERLNTNQGTISFWVKPSWNGNDGIYHTFFLGSGGSSLWITKASNNKLYFEPNVNYTAQNSNLDVSGWSANSWHLITCQWIVNNTIDGTNYIKMYVDGSLTGITNYSIGVLNGLAPSAGYRIGWNTTGGTQSAQALIDDFAIFDRILTTTEITGLYNAGTGVEAGTYADPSLKFYTKMDGSGTLSPVTYNLGASASKMQAAASELTGGTNLLLNSNMEAASSGLATSWTKKFGTETTADAEAANILFDTRSQKVTPPDSANDYGIYQNVTVTASTNYSISGWIKSDGTHTAGIYLYDLTNSSWIILASSGSVKTSSSSWTNISYTFKTNAGQIALRVYILTVTGQGAIFYTDNISLTPNLVDNGGIEIAGAGGADIWNGWGEAYGDGALADETTLVHSGGHAAKVTSGASLNTYAYETISLTTGTTYMYSVWARGDGTHQGRFVIQGTTSPYPTIVSIYTTSSTTYQRYTGTFTLPAGQTAVWFYLMDSATVGGVSYYDDASLIALDNVAGSFQSWTPVMDSPGANSTELATGDNSTFTSGIGTWTQYLGNGNATLVASGGKGVLTNTDGVYGWWGITPPLVVGKYYTIRVKLKSISGSTTVGFGDGSNVGKVAFTITGTEATYTGSFLATSVAFGVHNGRIQQIQMDDISIKETPNPLSVQGSLTGVSSNTSGARGNAYTFDGSTGYLRQKTYAVNIGTLSYGTNLLNDSGQTFTPYKSANPATYMIVVTNSDNTTTWGYIGAGGAATVANIYTTKAEGAAGWNGTNPTNGCSSAACTPVGYEIRKTDYQITGNMTVGAWVKTADANGGIIDKYDTVNAQRSFVLMNYAVGGSGYKPSLWISGDGTTFSSIKSTVDIDNDTWHFVAGIYNGTTLKLYVDGNDVSGVITGAVPASLFDGFAPLILARNNASGLLTGSLDSPFVIASALTADQIKDIYNSTAAHYGLVTNNTATNTQPANAASPTVDANTYHSWLINSIAASVTLSQDGTTIATSTTTLPATSDYIRLQNTDTTNALTIDWVAFAKGSASDTSAATATDEEKSERPMAYWKLDEGQGTTTASSGTIPLIGTLTGTTWVGPDMCISNNCLQFNGTTSNVAITGSLSNVQSIAFWVKPVTSTVTGGLINLSATASVSVTAGAVAASAGISNPTYYINGIVQTSPTLVANQWSYVEITTETGFTTDSINLGKVSSTYLNGFMDEIKLFNYARTAAQVKADYNGRGSAKGQSVSQGETLSTQGLALLNSSLSSGLIGWWKMDDNVSGNNKTLVDSSGNANSGTTHYGANATGMDCTTMGKFGTNCTFDGVDDYVSIPDNTPLRMQSHSLTGTAWIKAAPTSPHDVILSKGASSSTVAGYWFSVTSVGKLDLYISDGTNYIVLDGGTYATSTAVVADGTWHHVGFTWNPNRGVEFYVDGRLDSFHPATASTSIEGNTILLVGGWSSSTFTVSGSLDDVRIYNRALSPSEVTQLYNYSPNRQTYWPMEENAGLTTLDMSGNGNTVTLQPGTVYGVTPTWTQGKFGAGILLNGDNYLNAPSSSTLTQTGSFGVGAYFKPTSTADGVIAAKGLNYKLSTEGNRAAFTTNAISTQLSGTAITDVYFYDTTKDTNYGDGTANDPLVWRFDTTKSWYSETKDHTYAACNIATDDRCGNSEFPEKAYIVSTVQNIYIFDAQENAMWMKFVGNGGGTSWGSANMLGREWTASSSVNGIYALNGEIYAAGYYYGLNVISFLGDNGVIYYNTGKRSYNGTISQRNATLGNTLLGATPAIISGSANDVYTAVISGKTYVAVATDGGVSVLNETDGTVTNFTNTGSSTPTYNVSNFVVFDRTGNLYFAMDASGVSRFVNVVYKTNGIWATGSTSVYTAASKSYSTRPGAPMVTTTLAYPKLDETGTYIRNLSVTSGTSTIDGTSNTIYVAMGTGLAVIQEKQGDEANGSVKYITKDYITEEMVGDIRGMWSFSQNATLADTNVVPDDSYRATDLTSVAGATVVAGVRGKAFTFNGTSQYLKQKVYQTDTGSTWGPTTDGLSLANGAAFMRAGETLGTEKLTNGNMETGNPPSSWTITTGTSATGVADQSPGGTGSQAIEFTVGVTNTWLATQTTAVTSGNYYKVSAWAKNIDSTLGCSITIGKANYTIALATGYATATGVWTKLSGYFTATGTENYYVAPVMAVADNGKKCRFDDISVKQVTSPILSTYAGTDGSSTPYMLVLKDSASHTAWGYMGTADVAEALSTEKITNGNFESGSTGWTLTGGAGYSEVINDGSNNVLHLKRDGGTIGMADQNVSLTAGKLYKITLTITAHQSGTTAINLRDQSSITLLNFGPAVGTYTSYLTAPYAITSIRLVHSAATGENNIDNFSIKEVTDVGTDGVHILSTKNGATRNWAGIDASFNYNDSSYTFEVRKTDFQITTGSMTVGAWLKTSTAGNIVAFAKGDSGSISTNSYRLTYYGASSIGYTFETYSGSTQVQSRVGSYSDSGWHYVVGVFDNTNNIQYLYLDGALADSRAQTGDLNDTPEGLLVAARYSSGAIGARWVGTIDEPFVTASVLSANEIKHMYEVGKRALVAQGTNALNGTSNQVNAVVAGGLSNYFTTTGTAKNTTAKLYAGTQGGGVSEIDLNSDTLVNYFTNATTPAINSATVTALTLDSGGTFVAGMDSGFSRLNSVSGKTNIPSGTWRQVIGSFDKSTGYYSLFENGILTGQVNVGTTHTPLSNATTLSIGSYFYGSIDQVEINNFAPTVRLADKMTTGNQLTQKGGPPIAWYKFDEGTGTVAHDSTSNGLNGTISNATWSNDGKYNKALYFNGSTSYVLIPGLFNSPKNLTLSAWVNLEAQDTVGAEVVSLGDSTAIRIENNKIWGWFYNGTTWPGLSYTTPMQNNGWHHIIYTFDNDAKSQKLYLDGKLVNSGSELTSISYTAGSDTYIGKHGDGQTNVDYKGKIDEVKIFPYALTPDEVKVEYNHGSALALGALNTASNSAAMSYCVPGSTDPCTPPVGEWNFEEPSPALTGTKAYDTSGNGNDGTWAGTGTNHSTVGKLGKAGNFNGSDDYVSIGATKFDTLTNATFETWFKYTGSFDKNRNLFNVYKDTTNRINLFVSYSGGYGNKIAYETWVGGSSVGGARTDDVISANTWYHVAVTCGTNGIKMYLNGNLQTIGSAGTSCYSAIAATASNFIGNYAYNTASGFQGSIDQVRIYNYARTPAQIAWDYNKGLPMGWWKFDEQNGAVANDSSGNGNPGTVIAANFTTGKINNSLSFNGTTAYVGIANYSKFNFSDPATISTWVNTASDTCQTVNSLAGTTYQIIYIGNGCTSSLTNEIVSVGRSTTGNYIVGYTTSNRSELINSGWHLLTVTYDSSAVKIYIDGVSKPVTVGSGSNTGKYGGVTGVNDLSIGSSFYSSVRSSYFSGQIDDYKIFNYALTPTQIKTEYNNGAYTVRPPTAVAYLLNDQFITPLAAGAINGTYAEPTGGIRTVVDTGGKLSITGGQLSFAAGATTWGDPGIWYPAVTRVAGKMVIGKINFSDITADKRMQFGFSDTTSGSGTSGKIVSFVGPSTVTGGLNIGGTTTQIGTIAASTDYQMGLILRATGAYYYIKGGTFTNWTLVWIGSTDSTSTLYPYIANNSATFTADNIRIPTSTWLPTPLAYDTFGTASSNSTESSGPDGQAAPKLSWSNTIGTWANAGGTAAATALSSSVAARTVSTGKADVIIDAAVTRSAGNAGIIFRYQDATNYLIAYHNGTNAIVDKVVAGVTTNVISGVAAYSAGAVLRVMADGTTNIRLYYNNAQVGTGTISNFATATVHGLYTTDTGNTFDNFTVWPRGTGNEFSTLNNY